MTDSMAQEDLMLKVFPSWKGKTFSKRDLSGAGGAKLFMYSPQGDNIMPFAAVLKISKAHKDSEAPKEKDFTTKTTIAAASCIIFHIIIII